MIFGEKKFLLFLFSSFSPFGLLHVSGIKRNGYVPRSCLCSVSGENFAISTPLSSRFLKLQTHHLRLAKG